MNEENDLYQQEVQMDEDVAFMPDGYAEGDDFFNPDAWSGGKDADSAPADASQEHDDGPQPDTGTEEAPATEPTDEPVSAETGDNADGLPATEPQDVSPSTKRRVRYQFDHEDREEEIDDADLPELLQKARSVDRYKQRLISIQAVQDKLASTARVMEYEDADKFLDAILESAKSADMDKLRSEGVADMIAKDYVQRKYADIPQAIQTDGRDFLAEAQEFLAAKPWMEGKKLPQEVIESMKQSGATLLQAYTEYERKVAQAEAQRARDEADKLAKENRILKNNADSADRAPVSGVSKGGRTEDAAVNDDFLKGFNSI